MAELLMPKLGADMTAGTLVAWTKQPGEHVRRGDVVAQVDTDKGVIDIEVFSTGVLEQILVAPGQTVPVGTPLAIVREVPVPPPGTAGLATPPPLAPTGPAAPRAMEAGPAPTEPASGVPPPSATVATARQAARPPEVTGLAQPATPAAQVGREGPAAHRQALAAGPARLRISPSARELARALGVDPTTVQGTGRGGAITREDIERAAAARSALTQTSTHGPPPPGPVAAAPPAGVPVLPAEPAGVRVPSEPTGPSAAPGEPSGGAAVPAVPAAERAARMRQAIAAAMSRSKREIPHYYLGTTIDLHRALTWLATENERRPIRQRLLYSALLLKAVALALREFPELNGFWSEGRFQPSAAIHLGVAISLRQGGLIAPALHHADQLDLGTLMERLRDLVQRARSGSLRGSELSDPTMTVTNLGEQGVEMVFPVIHPPQVAIVGFGKVVERACVIDGQVVVHPTITATLAADHRASDGHRGGLFLAAVDRLLQQPENL